MVTLLHFIPHVLLTGLAFLALAVMIGEASTGSTEKRPHAQRLPRQYYSWNERGARHN